MKWMAGVLSLVGVGCTPPCSQLCRKVLDCGLDTERVGQLECELSCEQQGALYVAWQDQELIDLYADHKRCVLGESCDALAAGACYEGYEALFVF